MNKGQNKGGRGPKVPIEWKRYLKFRALDERHVPRTLLADDILQKMTQSRDWTDPESLPDRESLAKEITTTRHHPIKDVDKPWSVAASIRHAIPEYATKDLFDIWRLSLVIGNPISIREAKWIVHLRTLYPSYEQSLFNQAARHGVRVGVYSAYQRKVFRNLNLIILASQYSFHERVAEMMDEEAFDSSWIDSYLTSWLEYFFINSPMKKLSRPKPISDPVKLALKLGVTGDLLNPTFFGPNPIELIIWQQANLDYLKNDQKILETDFPWDQSEDADIISAHWLWHFAKGPNWNSMSIEQRREIRTILHNWVSEFPGGREPYPPGPPDELFTRVGYEIRRGA